MLEPGTYHLGTNGRQPNLESPLFQVGPEYGDEHRRLQNAKCLHGAWSMTMWLEDGCLVGKVDGWPGYRFHNITARKPE